MCNFIIYYCLMIPQFILPSNLQLKAETIYSEPGVLYIHTSVLSKIFGLSHLWQKKQKNP